MPRTNLSIGHLEGIESPWGNAGGVVKTIEDLERMSGTGVGWIEDGSHTLERRLSNAVVCAVPPFQARVYFHDAEQGLTVNSLGMPGQGMDAIEDESDEKVTLAEMSHKKYILNVAPVSTDPFKESIELVSRGYEAGAHAVLLNAGCPNVITEDGGRHELLSRSPDQLAMVLNGLKDTVEKYQPIFIRISPQESLYHAKKIFRVIRDSGVVSAVFTPNTWPGHLELDKNGEPVLEVPGGVGGKSGPVTANLSHEQTFWAVDCLRDTNIDVVSSSGITTAAELQRRLAVGAVAGAGTTFFYESTNGWADDTNRLLSEL